MNTHRWNRETEILLHFNLMLTSAFCHFWIGEAFFVHVTVTFESRVGKFALTDLFLSHIVGQKIFYGFCQIYVCPAMWDRNSIYCRGIVGRSEGLLYYMKYDMHRTAPWYPPAVHEFLSHIPNAPGATAPLLPVQPYSHATHLITEMKIIGCFFLYVPI